MSVRDSISLPVLENWCARFGYGYIMNAKEIRLIAPDGEWLYFAESTTDEILLEELKEAAPEG